MKHDRLSILRAQEAARLEQEKADAFYVKAVGRSTQYRDDPTYRDKVLAFEARQTTKTPEIIAPYAIGAGNRNVALGRAINACAQEIDRIQAARKTEKRSFQIGDRVRVVYAQGRANYLKRGMELVVTGIGPIMGGERTISVDERCRYFHREGRFDLVEAAGSTAPEAEEPKYWVCVKAYETPNTYRVGDVRESKPSPGLEHHWLLCDKNGWITHDPQPDSTCPVPEDVKPEAKLRNGAITDLTDAASWQLGWIGDRTPSLFDIVAWRPVKS